MSVIDTRFENHAVHDALNRAQAGLEQAKERGAGDSELVDYFAFADQGLVTIVRLLSAVDPHLVSVNLLQEAESHANGLVQRFSQYASNGDRNQITGLIGQVDAINQVSASLASVAAIAASEAGLQDAVTSYRRSAGQHVANLAVLVSDLKEDVGIVESRATELAQAIKEQNARLDSVVAEYQQQFSEAQQTRTQQWSDELKEFNDKRTEAIEAAENKMSLAVDSLNTKGESTLASIENDAKAALEDLENWRAQARKLIEATAVDAVTRDYKSAAAEDIKAANRWRLAALGSMALGITAIIAFALLIVPSDGLDWVGLVRAVVIGGAFAAPALFSQRESNKHRAAALQNQRVALELDALEPFLANFEDPPMEIEIKRAFADRVFGGSKPAEYSAEEQLELTNSGLIELLKLFAKKL